MTTTKEKADPSPPRNDAADEDALAKARERAAAREAAEHALEGAVAAMPLVRRGLGGLRRRQ